MLPCSYQMQEIVTEFYIVEADNRTVLSLVSDYSTEQIKDNFSKVFHGLGKLDECYQMQLNPQPVPVVQMPRKIPAIVTQ